MKTKLIFYFDYISHNAYLAWTALPGLAEKYQLTIEPVPILFAGLLNHYGQLGPAETLPKALWMTKDVIRKADRLNIPLSPPASHPFNPLLPLRVTLPVQDPEKRHHLIDALFRATWAKGLDVSSPAVVESVSVEAGLDGKKMVEQATTAKSKNALVQQTKQAIEAGVFGVPTFVIDEELFWGFDDLKHVVMFIEGRDPLQRSQYSDWLNVKPTSVRKESQREC